MIKIEFLVNIDLNRPIGTMGVCQTYLRGQGDLCALAKTNHIIFAKFL